MMVCMAFVSCVEDVDFVVAGGQEQDAIRLSAGEVRATRATTAPLSAEIRDFKVYGVKQTASDTYDEVFDNYVVWYDDNTDGTTQSNSRGWEYVGTIPSEAGYSYYTCQTIADQTIKYWDYNASRYVFWGAGRADLVTGFTGDNPYKVTFPNLQEADLTSPSRVIYYSQPKVVEKHLYRQPVQLEFRRFLSRIRFGFYETIPGYAVKDVRFYTAGSDASPSDECTLGGQYIKNGGTLEITYDLDPATPALSLSYDAATLQYNTTHTFGTLHYTKAEDNLLTGSNDSDSFLGRISSAATYAGNGEGYYTNIFPNPDNVTDLTLKVDYTLLSTDGSGQQIEVKGATAIVPGNFCHWQPNHSYTYLFKISDNTNGSTGGDVVGLYPITFTAYAEVAGTDNNQLGTVTTFGEWSITTHQKNDVLNGGIVYYKGKQTEVSAILADGSQNVKEFLDGTANYIVIYHQQTNNEWEVEATTSDLTTPVAGVYLETIDKYENGFAYFTPDIPGTYRIEYWHQEGSDPAVKRAIKIMKVEDKVGFNIHYELNGHGHPILDTENAVVVPNPLPTLIDDDPVWTFVGWYKDEDLTVPAEPGTDLTDDITLYAKWHKVFTGQDLEDTNMNP